MSKIYSKLIAKNSFDITKLLRCRYYQLDNYIQMTASPATGLLYITENSPHFIHGHICLLARKNGQYPYKYLQMIDRIFGHEDSTIEVCSRSVKGIKQGGACLTVDINPDTNPDIVDDAQKLDGIADGSFRRWRADPPYNEATAKDMYNTKLPNTGKLLEAKPLIKLLSCAKIRLKKT
jgi:hypothetical protein